MDFRNEGFLISYMAILNPISLSPHQPELFENVPMGKAKEWNCQNWVTEVVEKLREEGYLEEGTKGTSYITSKYQKKWKNY